MKEMKIENHLTLATWYSDPSPRMSFAFSASGTTFTTDVCQSLYQESPVGSLPSVACQWLSSLHTLDNAAKLQQRRMTSAAVSSSQ
jgi:hypothetical protein